MRQQISQSSPLFESRGVFAAPGGNIDELLDFLEDMILMAGCPDCNSLNTRIIVEDNVRLLLCMECGSCEELPPAS